MKALSLWQPWASLMAVGAKKIETRHWTTSYRGLVAIHAAKRFQSSEKALLGQKIFHDALDDHYEIKNQELDLPLGCFVAVGRLYRVLSTDIHIEAIPLENTNEFWFGDYSEGRYMWIFDEIWKLRQPVFARGFQGLWTPTDSERDVIEEMMPEGVRQIVNAHQ